MVDINMLMQRGLISQNAYGAAAPPNDPSSNFDVATKEMSLTPQEQNIYQHHLNNLNGSGKVMNQDGSVSTVYQAVVNGPDGKYYNIPTVWNGKILPPDQAVDKATSADQGGWKQWPSYNTPEEADTRYGQMHDYMGEDTQRFLQSQQGGQQ